MDISEKERFEKISVDFVSKFDLAEKNLNYQLEEADKVASGRARGLAKATLPLYLSLVRFFRQVFSDFSKWYLKKLMK